MKWLIDTTKKDTKLPAIIRAAVGLFVEKGIEATTTREIAEAAQVAEGTLYRHFKGKEEMAFNIFVHHLEAFTNELEAAGKNQSDLRNKLRAMVAVYFTFFETERTLFEYIVAFEHQELRNYPVEIKNPFHVVSEILEEGIQKGEIPPQDTTFSTAYIIGMVHRVSYFRVYKRVQDPLTNHIDRVAEACWRVVKNTPADMADFKAT